MILSFYISPEVFRACGEALYTVDYMESSNHLPDSDIFIGDDTLALLLSIEEDGESIKSFYKEIIKFYEAFIKKLLKVHDFKSPLFHELAYLEPSQSQCIMTSTIDLLDQIYPVAFNKQQVKLEMREFVIDCEIDLTVKDAVQFWLQVMAMKSAMGEQKYLHMATLSLRLLSIPASNADSERVFSVVR